MISNPYGFSSALIHVFSTLGNIGNIGNIGSSKQEEDQTNRVFDLTDLHLEGVYRLIL